MDTTERVKYVIEIDDQGAAKVAKVFTDAAAQATAQMKAVLPGTPQSQSPAAVAGNVSQILALIHARIGDVGRELSGRLYDITLAVRASAAGAGITSNVVNNSINNVSNRYPATPVARSAGLHLDRLQNMAQAAALGAFGIAAEPEGAFGAAFGTAGKMLSGAGIASSALGGPLGPILAAAGSATVAIGSLGATAMAAAESLKDFSPAIGGAMAQLEIFTIGFKMQLGQGLGEPIQKIVGALEQLLVELSPLLIDLGNLAGRIIPPLANGLGQAAKYIDLLIAELEKLFAWVDLKTAGGASMLAHPINGKDTQQLSDQLDFVVKELANFQSHQIDLETLKKRVNELLGSKEIPGMHTLMDIPGVSGLVPKLESGDLHEMGKALADLHELLAKFQSGTLGVNPPGQQGLAAALSGANRHVEEILRSIKDNTARTNDLLDQGHKQNVGFLDAIDLFSRTNRFGTMRQMDFEQVPEPQATIFQDRMPAVPRSVESPLSTPQQFANRKRGSSTGFPLPSNSPVNMTFHNAMTITPEEDDRVFAELMQLRQEMVSAIDMMNDTRWMKLAVARAHPLT